MQAQLDVRRKTDILAAARAVQQTKSTPGLEKHSRGGETVIQTLLLICGTISILTTLGIVIVLGSESLLFFGADSVGGFFAKLGNFFTGTLWQPEVGAIGILPLLTATFLTSFIAILVAGPLGLGAAIYLSEYATPRRRATLKPTLELLAGVPTVVYGFFAILTVSPFLRGIFNADGVERMQFQNMLVAGVVMGFMIIPTIASMSEDSLSAVPRALREASYGMGATRLETILKVVVPAALSGFLAAFILGISRAVGETMIVALAAGGGPNFTFNPLQAAETMTGHIVRISGGEISYNSVAYNSLFAIGLTLFILTLILNTISRYITNRFREAY